MTLTVIERIFYGGVFSAVLLVLAGCGSTQQAAGTSTRKRPAVQKPGIDFSKYQPDRNARFTVQQVPPTPREFRGVWVATVSNVDWPSEPGLPVAKQKAQLKAIMEKAAELHLNAVIFQIRPAADALYNSSYEPWSYYLTGEQGRAPEPYYDPLKFAIKQAHKRGLELHVWFNPFRAYHPSAEEEFAPGHVINTHPEWVVQYGDYYWLNPGLKAVRQYTIKVIMDVVRRYDVDGVHLDDYFYPYPLFDSQGNPVPFPDDAAYHRYLKNHPYMTRGDWRRHNVNMFIKNLSAAIEQADSTILFGISPFGIWRPGHPPGVAGLDVYKYTFADSRKWLRKGWVDYLAPQLYWASDNEGQRFPVLLRWWKKQNWQNHFVWPGLYTSNIANYPEFGFPAMEIIYQISLSRDILEVDGHIHFSMSALMQNYGGISDKLKGGIYQKEALVPAAAWRVEQRPPTPAAVLIQKKKYYKIRFTSNRKSSPWLWVVKAKYGNKWSIDIFYGQKNSVILPDTKKGMPFLGAAVSAVNAQSAESKPALLFPVPQGDKLAHHPEEGKTYHTLSPETTG